MTIKEYLKKELQNKADAINGLVKPDYKNFGKILVTFTGFFALLIIMFFFSVRGFAEALSRYGYIILPMVLFFIICISIAVIMPKKSTWAFRREYFDKKAKNWKFTEKQISAAADLLIKLNPAKYWDLVNKYSAPVVDILMITKSIDTVSDPERLQRIVSIKAIEKDTEAGEEE